MSGDAWDEVEALLVTMETHHVAKVFGLARRLLPHITHEDMRNPHDFPELDDKDWHFEDGVLSGIQAVLSAVRARRREHDSGGNGRGGSGGSEEP